MADDGRSFEVRALALARAIHDPLGLQGPMVVLGRERDGVFVSDDAIHVFEFTTRRDKEKARSDGAKLADLLDHLAKDHSNKFKTRTGWFVTADEPTADQADAIRAAAKARAVPLHAVSYSTLRRRICDVEGYIAARDSAPFGGAVYAARASTVSVDPEIGDGPLRLSIRDVANSLTEGARRVLVGDFGVGKSFAARMLYQELRRLYFKNTATRPFPIHVNLRDCAGLKSPAEILRRHAEEIGFAGEKGLISAWRSGACVLILDGFDEIIPNRLVGAATNLRQVRWEALSPVRRLVEEAPESSGVIVTGRSNYFSTDTEMLQGLGMGTAPVLRLADFTDAQVAKYLQAANAGDALPEWLPARPLFLSSLAAADMLEDLASIDSSLGVAEAWRSLVRMICERESKIYATVPPDTIRALLAHLSVLSKVRESERGELGLEDMKLAFAQVSGRQTDEEALQLLLRLPGLAVAQIGQTEEARVFSDRGLASATYGESLADYLASPYQGNVLCDPAAWSSAGDEIAIEVAAAALKAVDIAPSQVAAACQYRFAQGHYDAILLDAIQVADEVGAPARDASYIVVDVVVNRLDLPAADGHLARTHIRGALISDVDFSQADEKLGGPTFEQCIIGHAYGVSSVPPALEQYFPGTEIESFDDETGTTHGILSLDGLSVEQRVTLSILHKVYAKRGSGRKDSALRRGLTPSDREYVGPCLTRLLGSGLVQASQRGSVTVYLPVRGRRADVLSALEAPTAKVVTELLEGA